MRLTPAPPSRRVPLPLVLINMSMTADGKIATANRRVASFGSQRDLAHLYELRASADAVMCGARTLRSGSVTLGIGGPKYCRARVRHGLREHHLRVLVSGSGSLVSGAAVFRKRCSPIIVLTTARAGSRQLDRLAEMADDVLVCGESELDFRAGLAHLRRRWGVQRLLCEGGGELNDALFRAGLVDELHLTICPFIFGGREAPTIAEGLGVARLTEAARLRLARRRWHGDELFCLFSRQAK